MRLENLHKIISLIQEDKFNEYGPVHPQMQKIADAWSAFLNTSIRGWQVPVMYALAKAMRASHGYKEDNYIDAINYLMIADEIHREDSSKLEEK